MTFKSFFPLTIFLLLSTGLRAEDKLDITGTWDTKTSRDGEVTEAKIVVTSEGDDLKGVVHRKDNETDLKTLSLDGNKVSLELEFDYQGTDILFAVKAEASESGNTLTGKWTASDSSGTELATGDWSATKEEKPAPLEGAWDTVAILPEDKEVTFVSHFEGAGDDLKGYLSIEKSITKYSDIKLKAKTLQFEMVFPYDGTNHDVRIKAELKEDDLLEGKWIAFESDGSEKASGSWKAKRKGESFDIVGQWAATASMDDGSEIESAYHFTMKEDKLTGHSDSDRGKVDFDTVKLAGKTVTLDMELPYDGSTIDVRINAESTDDANELTGKWVVFDDAGQEAATGAWKAKRQAKSE